MEANELMIGNYLLDRKDRLCRVESIQEDGFNAPAIIGPETAMPNKPIPLTEEWLVKFGFESYLTQLGLFFNKVIDENNSFEFYQTRGESEDGKDDVYGVRINEELDVEFQFVHQLQNLYFALTQTHLTNTKRR